MILRLSCPWCNNDSYSASVESFRPCPYCGLRFSGKHGIERRNEKRFKKKIPFVFFYRGQNIKASTVNFSEHGLCIKMMGKPCLSLGDAIELNIEDLDVKAKIIWVSDNPDATVDNLNILY